jgi:hypothetical protein
LLPRSADCGGVAWWSPTRSQVKKSYYQLSLTHHPDKGGDEKVFKRINRAHNVLRGPLPTRSLARSLSLFVLPRGTPKCRVPLSARAQQPPGLDYSQVLKDPVKRKQYDMYGVDTGDEEARTCEGALARALLPPPAHRPPMD